MGFPTHFYGWNCRKPSIKIRIVTIPLDRFTFKSDSIAENHLLK